MDRPFLRCLIGAHLRKLIVADGEVTLQMKWHGLDMWNLLAGVCTGVSLDYNMLVRINMRDQP